MSVSGFRIVALILVVVTVLGVGVVFVMNEVGAREMQRERAIYSGKWVLKGSTDDYILLNVDGTYEVHVGVYGGSIPDQQWTIRDRRIFIPTETRLTVGGPGSGDETAYGWTLEVSGDRLVSKQGSSNDTYRRP